MFAQERGGKAGNRFWCYFRLFPYLRKEGCNNVWEHPRPESLTNVPEACVDDAVPKYSRAFDSLASSHVGVPF